MNKMLKKLKAYTLAEVVIVMLVIAVVAGVSIKITKAKLDNIISYTYYMGYSTLRNVTGQMIADFNPNDEDYTDVAALKKDKKLPNVFLLAVNWIIENFELPVWAADQTSKIDQGCLPPANPCPSGQMVCSQNSPGAKLTAVSLGCPNGQEDIGYNWCCSETNLPPDSICPVGKTYNSSLKKCVCSTTCEANETQNSSTCECVKNACNKTCGANQTLDEDTCTCIDNPTPNTCANQPSDEEIHNKLCQEQLQWQGYPTCGYTPVPCNQEGSRWSQTSCACVPEIATLPRKGANFCEKFLDYTNTKSTAEECNGDAIASNLTDFTDKKADIVLRNGLKLYNVRQNPAPLPLLAGNNQGGSYELADGTTVNVNEFGYTVYLDIDGEKGSSTLWEDVFPFYITMAGKVIPLYHTEGEKEYGGTSRQHLMTSVQKEVITTTGHRQVLWIKKSVPFKESACTSGYINSTTPYCSGVSLEPTCNEGANVCILKYVSPVKFF